MLENEKRIGIYTENGKLMKDGKPFITIGVNYLGLFYDALSRNFDVEKGLKGMEVLAGYGVKLIRVPVNATYSLDAFLLYFHQREEWFGLLDKIVKKAEELHIGLLCSFFWSERVIPRYFGEEVGDSMRREDSRSSRYMEEYVREFILRYGESEAVWGWEYGNEIMLEAQLPAAAESGCSVARTSSPCITVLSARFPDTTDTVGLSVRATRGCDPAPITPIRKIPGRRIRKRSSWR